MAYEIKGPNGRILSAEDFKKSLVEATTATTAKNISFNLELIALKAASYGKYGVMLSQGAQVGGIIFGAYGDASEAKVSERKSLVRTSEKETIKNHAKTSVAELKQMETSLTSELEELYIAIESVLKERKEILKAGRTNLYQRPVISEKNAWAIGKSEDDLYNLFLDKYGQREGVSQLLTIHNAVGAENVQKTPVTVEPKTNKTVAQEQLSAADTQASLRESFDKFFADLLAEVKTGFTNLVGGFSASANAAPDLDAEYEQEVQAISKNLMPALQSLQNQYESNSLTVENYRSNLETLKVMYAGYPEILAIVEEREKKIGEEQNKTISGTRALIKNLTKASNEAQGQVDNLASDTLIKLSDGFASAIVKGEDLGNTLKNLGDNILYVVVRAMMLKMVSSLFSSLFGGGGSSSLAQNPYIVDMEAPLIANARGNVFGPQGLKAFAKGGIVSQPTLFGFSKGIGLMGEAGAEAIMPLGRDSRGNLGVRVADSAMSGTGTGGVFAPHVEINVENKGGGDMSEEQARTLGSQVKAIVEMQVAKQMYEYMRNGTLRPSMGRGY